MPNRVTHTNMNEQNFDFSPIFNAIVKMANKKDEDTQKLFKELIDQGYPTDQAAYMVKQSQGGIPNTNIPTIAPFGAEGNRPPPIPGQPSPIIGADGSGITNVLPPSNVPSRPVPITPNGGVSRSTIQPFHPKQPSRLEQMNSLVGVSRVNADTGQLESLGSVPRGSKIIPTPKNTSAQDEKGQAKLYKDSVAAFQKFYGSRSGNFGVQDTKVNQAIHIGNLADQYYDPKTDSYDIPEAQFNETVMGLANLVSGSNVSTVEGLRSITPKNFRSDMSHIAAYWSGKPITNQPQAMIRNILDSVDRQGAVSENLRDNYLSQAKDLFIQPGLNQENTDRVLKSKVGNSYKEYMDKRQADRSSATPTITNQADYDKLPSGTNYLSSDGKLHKKK